MYVNLGGKAEEGHRRDVSRRDALILLFPRKMKGGRMEGKEQNIGKNSLVINITEMGVSKNTDTWHASLVLSRIHFFPELQLHS